MLLDSAQAGEFFLAAGLGDGLRRRDLRGAIGSGWHG